MADLIPYLAARDASAAIAFYVTDAHGDRGGWLFDPAGHRWSIVTSGKELSRDELQEQVGATYEIT